MPSKRKAEPFYGRTIEDDEDISDEQSDSEDDGLPAHKRQHMNPDFVWDGDDFGFGGLGGAGNGNDDEEAEEEQTKADMEWIGAERMVDLSAIIQRRREKREAEAGEGQAKKASGKDSKDRKKAKGDEETDGEEEESDDEEDDGNEDQDLDLDDDELLADDGFGMGANSDEEDDGVEIGANGDDSDGEDDDMGADMDEEHADSDDGEAASDSDSVATPIGHPDDHDPESDSDASSDEDAEESARQKAFFADGEKEKLKAKKGKQGKNGSRNDGDSDEEGEDGNSLASVPTFESMRIFSRPILRAVAAAGFRRPTKIQAKTMPFAVGGKDVVGQAVTGSGKTAAFLLPILERLLYRPSKVPKTRVVILTPTRELAVQCHAVAVKLAQFTSITMVLAVGGTSFKATEPKLRARPDIVIGTPGRFIDHMRNTPGFAVDATEILVLDEADRMLQDGFADELNEIVKFLPRSRQTMLFSATMTAPVDQLIRVGMLRPVRVVADSGARTAGTLTQEFVRLRAGREDARLGYLLHLCTTLYRDHTIVFFREKRYIHEARVVFGLLGLTCEELHGNIKQAERSASLESFRRGAVSFLLASDLASRGLDIKGVQTVINYEVPKTLDDYIHRIGRTARAGHRGVAVTLVAEADRKFVRAATKAMRKGETGGTADGGAPSSTKFVIKSRSVDPAAADAWQAKIEALEDDIAAIIEEEREARKLAVAEMEVTRGENLLKHKDEILARPKKTWFETPREKEAKKAKEAAARRTGMDGAGPLSDAKQQESVERLRDKLKSKRVGGKLSNKDMKKLDNKADRLAGMGGKKLKQEKKALSKPGSKPGSKPAVGKPVGKPVAKPAAKPAAARVVKPATGARGAKGPKASRGGGRGGRGGSRGGKR
ncbi:ATP-dependent RNA helicase DDX27 [Sporothrix schenckii 1099-18]|uniref:RNA helicase n=1 Tax=Sporothrix schenckii 1099-18 TaxID=1397361 RepID=A0A0F2MA92_SPOSC|nr:ATP-dependent RNA helicase DDX27 [Sporothrix schenckii 1099-18]KJR86557.1 ATP-dependent RNA helicase DDX27 [Sporothrix schenckii 1099-18]